MIVIATASDPAPFSSWLLTLVARWRNTSATTAHALIIYDDLTKQAGLPSAVAAASPPSGSRLTRATFSICTPVCSSVQQKFGRKPAAARSTALPIIETQGGDISAYIPTNVISITDGQIFLKATFSIGIRPAVNVGISVSRVGGPAQIKAMRQVAGPLS